MGWRTWNAFRMSINQSRISSIIDGITLRRWSINGTPTSLADLGYNAVGIDDGWEACGAGVNGSFHNSTGFPIIDASRFPDMAALVSRGHAAGVSVGWYMNCCGCQAEHNLAEPHYSQDAQAAATLGFDGIKVDGCGNEPNISAWAAAMNATGRPMLLENCNDNYPYRPPAVDECPYNMYRTSIDNAPQFLSAVSNLLDTSQFLATQSGPGCWAYPDMLEIGAPALGDPSIPNDCPGQSRMSVMEAQGSFAAWCVVSLPLTLSFDIANLTEYDTWWPIVSNTRAIAINQAWNGSPGGLAAQSNVSFNALVYHGSACEVSSNRSMPQWTVWAKPLADAAGSVAVAALNSWESDVEVSVPLSALGLAPGVTADALDVWTGKAAGQFSGSWVVPALASHDSRFVVLTPQQNAA